MVVKPTDGNHGRGVFAGPDARRPRSRPPSTLAAAEGCEVMVERFIPGDEHRMLVVGGKVVAAARARRVGHRRWPQSTVDELIDSQINTDPRRGVERRVPAHVIVLDR